MPELPEVETVMRGLMPVITGQVIAAVTLNRAGLRRKFPKNLDKLVAGQKIIRLSRRAKYILIHLSHGGVIMIHLGMSGRIRTVPMASYQPETHDHVLVDIKNGQRLVLNDARRFGSLDYFDENDMETHPALKNLGPEPLSNHFSADILLAAMRNKATSIKQALLDQSVVVGVGNIYAAEALFDAKIDPRRAAKSLKQPEIEKLVVAIRDTLSRAIDAGGSTLKDYRQVSGESGYFQHDFKIYGKLGEKCVACCCDFTKTGGIQKITQGGRSTFFCPVKQA